MTPWDLLPLARLSAAAYEMDEDVTRQRVEALGAGFIAQIHGDADQDGDAEISVILARLWGRTVIAIQGTRITDHFSADGLACDLAVGPVVTNLGQAMSGFWSPLARLWPRVAAALPASEAIVVTGHSLGGARAHLVPALHACSDVVSFGAPKAAETKFWQRVYGPDGPSLIRVVQGRDFAPTYPWIDGLAVEYTHPGPLLWLRSDGVMQTTDARPGFNVSRGDHSIDSAYIPWLERWAV